VPKLRFPEFRDAEGWEQTALGDVARLKNGYAFKSADYVEDGPFQIITIANVQQGSLALDATKRIAQLPEEIQPHQQLQIGDILISMTGNVGRVCRVTCDSLLQNQRVGKLIAERIGSDFFYHLLQRDEFRNTMQLKAAGGAQGNLSSGDITEFALHRPPSPAEQQKIAECLSSMDELTAAQARKVDALRAHKKGLMQQLFPREGETQPRLRFPEFQNGGEWEETRLSQLGELVSGLTYSPDDVRESGLLVLRSSNVQNGEIALEDNIYVDPGIRGANLSLPNDILICIRNGSKTLIGKSALIPEGMPSCTHGAFMSVFRAQTPRFVFQLFQTARYHKQVAGDLGATINSINGSQLLKYQFVVPEPAEQQRIAECLSSLDDLITAETHKIEALKTHKKGLMQQLFPSLEEVEA